MEREMEMEKEIEGEREGEGEEERGGEREMVSVFMSSSFAWLGRVP